MQQLNTFLLILNQKSNKHNGQTTSITYQFLPICIANTIAMTAFIFFIPTQTCITKVMQRIKTQKSDQFIISSGARKFIKFTIIIIKIFNKSNQIKKSYNYYFVMPPKTYSIQTPELAMVQEFSLGLHIVEEVIKTNVSESLKISKVAINKSPLLNTPVFCLLNEKDTSQMSIQDFLNLFIDRWRQEIQYQQDILNFKDQIINEFDKLCNQLSDKNLIEATKKQSQQVVETLFSQTNFDKKQLAGEFCKNFMNGFEHEMISKIDFYAIYVVWSPFIMPQPEGLIDYMKNIFHEDIGEGPNEARIVNATAKLRKYIEDQLKEREFQIQSGISKDNILAKEKNIISINQLGELLKIAQMNKKACSVLINEVNENSNIISSERANIQTICVKMDAKQFLKTNISFVYEYLELKDLEHGMDWEQTKQILLKLPKCLKSAVLEFKSKKQNGIRIVKNEQRHAYELSFTQNGPSYTQMQLLTGLLNYFKFPLFFIIPKFEYKPKFSGTDEQITTLSNVFTHSKTVQHLDLDFRDATITTGAIDNLVASIGKMSQINYFHFNFSDGNNSFTNHSMPLFAQAISEMGNLHHFGLDFRGGKNKITDDGILQLCQAITKFTNIQQLILLFHWGKNEVTDKGIEELSQSIANFKSIRQLSLNFGGGNNGVSDKGIEKLSQSISNCIHLNDLSLGFSNGNNQISDKGMQAIAAALKSTFSLSKLSLVICYGQNTISKNGINFLANAVIPLNSPLDFYCRFIGHPNTVTHADIVYLKNAREYSRFDGQQIKKMVNQNLILTQEALS